MPREDWRRGVHSRPGGGEFGLDTYAYRWEWLYDTMVDVIDVARHELVASTRLPAFMIGLVDDGMAASYWEDDDGRPFVTLWRLTLRR